MRFIITLFYGILLFAAIGESLRNDRNIKFRGRQFRPIRVHARKVRPKIVKFERNKAMKLSELLRGIGRAEKIDAVFRTYTLGIYGNFFILKIHLSHNANLPISTFFIS